MERKKVQKNIQLSFGGRGKVQCRRKKLGDKVQAKSSNLPRRFCSNSVGTPLEFAACQEKHQHFHADRQLVTKKEISIKVNFYSNVKRRWPSGLVTGISRRRAGFDTQREQEFFPVFSFLLLLLLFNELNESIFTN